MERQAMAAAQELAKQYLPHFGPSLLDARVLLQIAAAGYMAGAGVPTDEAVSAVEQLAMKGPMGAVPPNPMYYGIPWMVPGPASGAPYYA